MVSKYWANAGYSLRFDPLTFSFLDHLWHHHQATFLSHKGNNYRDMFLCIQSHSPYNLLCKHCHCYLHLHYTFNIHSFNHYTISIKLISWILVNHKFNFRLFIPKVILCSPFNNIHMDHSLFNKFLNNYHSYSKCHNPKLLQSCWISYHTIFHKLIHIT